MGRGLDLQPRGRRDLFEESLCIDRFNEVLTVLCAPCSLSSETSGKQGLKLPFCSLLLRITSLPLCAEDKKAKGGKISIILIRRHTG